MMAVVEVRDLVRVFTGGGGMVRALDSISLTLEAGPPIGLVGPNGAGKTTFFSVLCGFLPPTSGAVEVLGLPPLHKATHARVAILPQDAALVKGVPVHTQLTFLAELQGFSVADAAREASRVLELVLLPDSARKPPEALSHGMLKRVAIAQTFIGDPELVLLDEPTAGLDPATATQIRTLIRSLDQERTFIVSSHNLEEIEDMCGSVVILNKGKITQYKQVSELVQRTSSLTFRLEKDPPEDARSIFEDVPTVTKVEVGQPGERRLVVYFPEADGESTQIAVLQSLTKAGIVFLEMSRGQSLQDKVVELTRKP